MNMGPFNICHKIYLKIFIGLTLEDLMIIILKKKFTNNVKQLKGKAGEISLIDVRRLVHCGSRISSGHNRIVFNAIYTSARSWKKPILDQNLKEEILKKNLSTLQKSFLI